MTTPNETSTQEEELARGTPSEGSPLWYEAKIATLTAERDAALAEVKEANEAMVRVGNNAERLRAEVERLKGEAGNKDIPIRVFADELATLRAAQKEAKQQVADLQAELRGILKLGQSTVVDGLKWLFSERERLAVTVAELQRDRERLNWLLEFITQHGGNGIADIPWTVVDPEEIMEDRIEVVFDRAAIDSTRAAMQAKGSQ